MEKEIREILTENDRRIKERSKVFNPITGEGCPLARAKLEISDYQVPVQFVPKDMLKNPLIKSLSESGSMKSFLKDLGISSPSKEDMEKLALQILYLRCKYDFVFTAANLQYIKPKGGGDDVVFILNRPQRRLLEMLENLRLVGKPIRIILLKARQWGGSTLVQLYYSWLQIFHKKGLNSLIVGHVSSASTEVLDMMQRMLKHLPIAIMYGIDGLPHNEDESRFIGVFSDPNVHRIPQRNCKVKIGTAERPDSCRGGDYNLVHCTEVGLWKKTDGKAPKDIVRSATSGTLYKPYTAIVYESTANGVGNFFHKEYVAAKSGKSQFKAMFVSWYEIENNEQTVDDPATFAANLYKNRESDSVASDREEPGKYLWYLWTLGATLENISWYITERKKYEDHASMASEAPSDDIEAFANSGANVFDRYQVQKLMPDCRAPRYKGDVIGGAIKGKVALKNVRFTQDGQGAFWIWDKPEPAPDGMVWRHRYLTLVDIGGRGKKSDWSVIVVFDRMFVADGGEPVVVAQWYGHIDMDLLAWKAAQISKYYNNALLVIESNTLETHDRDRHVEGDQSQYILNEIKDSYSNLYARKSSDKARVEEGDEVIYGFHTNIVTKPAVIATLIASVREHLWVERDERCLNELLVYERKQNGSYGAIQGEHDDLLMTRAIGLHISAKEMPLPLLEEERSKRNAVINRAATAAK